MADEGARARTHEPVMVEEVVEFLGGRDTVIDMTLGAGGHAEALLRSGCKRVVGIDRDPDAIALARARLAPFGDRFVAIHARFSEVPAGNRADGVLFDLGVSTMQLERGERGFSYRVPGPLDMRMGGGGEEGTESALDLVNSASEEELAGIVFEYGEERRARKVAAAVARARARRPIETTDELARVVAGAVGRRRGGPHPARRTFQALRIAVNRELEELAVSLPRAVSLLTPGGRVVTIAYHSLEDRMVKRFLAGEPRLRSLTRKPLRPSSNEAARNPRARSAKLRAAELVDDGESRAADPGPRGAAA
ncbi:MAG TPA: 16S rRNA (cytosine(1402)-N(4))-methyltransferase RsmH [Actinomycetota bacterium]|nr:16S rRNA (cytosine(1402)-N(4))-methyltransferase RsmH [Actinomycetota bacterium]